MQSEVRKVLEAMRKDWGDYTFFGKIDAAERADAEKREEPVHALRKAIAELTVDWRTKLEISEAKNTYPGKVISRLISRLISELNAIIATKQESQPAAATEPDPWRVTEVKPTKDGGTTVSFSYQNPDSQPSGPVRDEKFSFSVECKQCGQSACMSEEYAAACGCGAVFKLHRHNQPASEPSVTPTDEHIRAIAAQAVRDAMPDVLDKLAISFEWGVGLERIAEEIHNHANRLRKETS